MRILWNIDWIRKGPLYLPAHMKERLSLRAQIEGVLESLKARKKLLMLAGASLAAASILRAKLSEARLVRAKRKRRTQSLQFKARLDTQVPGKGPSKTDGRPPRLVPVAG
jgi:hypothetical protein